MYVIADLLGFLCISNQSIYLRLGEKPNNDQTKPRMDLSLYVDHEIMYTVHDREEKINKFKLLFTNVAITVRSKKKNHDSFMNCEDN